MNIFCFKCPLICSNVNQIKVRCCINKLCITFHTNYTYACRYVNLVNDVGNMDTAVHIAPQVRGIWTLLTLKKIVAAVILYVDVYNMFMIKGGGWSRKGLNFEWPYFSQYLSELYQIFSSCVLCGYIIN